MKVKPLRVAKRIGKWLTTLAAVLVVGWLLVSLGSCMVKDLRGPTPQEKAVIQAKVAEARKAKLEEIANRATVGENTTTFEVFLGSNWLDDMSEYYYLSPNDLPLIIDIFCRKHKVRVVGAPQLINQSDLWSYYTIYYEKVRR